MVEVIWTGPALADLDAIADYIALDNPPAARQFVRCVLDHVEQQADHPEIGSKPSELKDWQYRQIVEPPCRVFYRYDSECVYIVHVMRGERRLQPHKLHGR